MSYHNERFSELRKISRDTCRIARHPGIVTVEYDAVTDYQRPVAVHLHILSAEPQVAFRGTFEQAEGWLIGYSAAWEAYHFTEPILKGELP